jgi:hypothetical protein
MSLAYLGEIHVDTSAFQQGMRKIFNSLNRVGAYAVNRSPGIAAAQQYLERRALKARARVFLTMLTIHGFCAILAGGFAACGVWPMAAGCLAVVLVMQSEIRKEAR